METIVERPAALDVHKAQVTACVRVPAAGGAREQHVAEFATTVQGLLALATGWKAHGVTQVAMEATGVYWKPPWAILEDRFECLLVNARHVKQVPGRKTDVLRRAWLCRLLEAGLLNASFVPPKPIRTLRNLTRYRKARSASASARPTGCTRSSRTPGSSSTASPPTCSARQRPRDARRARGGHDRPGRCSPTSPRPAAQEDARAARGAGGPLRRRARARRRAILAHIDFLDESIDRLSAAIEEQIAPFRRGG